MRVIELREAAALMRQRAEAAAKPWHCWGDERLPLRSGMTAWSEDMAGYLGGEWGDHAASWHPDVALAVAGWLDATADRIERRPAFALTDPGATAFVVACAYLGAAAS